MHQSLNIDTFLEKSHTAPIIDVRTPAEFRQGHIPNAHNIPLFLNEERTKIGIIYKYSGKKQAILTGLDFVAPKASNIIKQAEKIAGGNNILLVHCWRGGMRSNSIAQLLSMYGFEVYILQGGYKSYRHWAIATFEKLQKIIILGGKTGSGKTDILKELYKQGEQIIDLEGLACHKGSAFGTINEPEQPTQEHFENILAHHLAPIDSSKRLWIEDESNHLGKISIPLMLWQQMRQAPVIFLKVATSERIEYLLNMYGTASKDEIASAVVRLQKKLGGANVQKCLSLLEDGYLRIGCEELLIYYDKLYMQGLQKRGSNAVICPFECSTENFESVAKELCTFATVSNL